MKRLSLWSGLLLIGILLLSGCKSPVFDSLGKSYNETQGRIEALEEKVARLNDCSHTIWHIETDRDHYKELSERYWQELLDAGVYEVDNVVGNESGVLRSFKKVK